MDDVDLLRAYGEARFGREWQTATARRLGQEHPDGPRDTIDPSLIRKWVRGARPVPGWVPRTITRIAAAEADSLLQEASDLTARAQILLALSRGDL